MTARRAHVVRFVIRVYFRCACCHLSSRATNNLALILRPLLLRQASKIIKVSPRAISFSVISLFSSTSGYERMNSTWSINTTLTQYAGLGQISQFAGHVPRAGRLSGGVPVGGCEPGAAVGGLRRAHQKHALHRRPHQQNQGWWQAADRESKTSKKAMSFQ